MSAIELHVAEGEPAYFEVVLPQGEAGEPNAFASQTVAAVTARLVLHPSERPTAVLTEAENPLGRETHAIAAVVSPLWASDWDNVVDAQYDDL